MVHPGNAGRRPALLRSPPPLGAAPSGLTATRQDAASTRKPAILELSDGLAVGRRPPWPAPRAGGPAMTASMRGRAENGRFRLRIHVGSAGAPACATMKPWFSPVTDTRLRSPRPKGALPRREGGVFPAPTRGRPFLGRPGRPPRPCPAHAPRPEVPRGVPCAEPNGDAAGCRVYCATLHLRNTGQRPALLRSYPPLGVGSHARAATTPQDAASTARPFTSEMPAGGRRSFVPLHRWGPLLRA